MHIQEILIVRGGTVSFGIPTCRIGQILRVPEITPLALSPREIHGMCAVGGNITSVIDLHLLLGMERVDPASAQSRILTLGEPYEASALIVSEVVESIQVDPERIEYLSGSDDPIIAIYARDEELIQILDVERLVRVIRTRTFVPGGIGEKHRGPVVKTHHHEEEGRYLLFRMGGEIYGLDIDHLREILGGNQPLTPLSGNEADVVGMMSLREELILVVDLRIYYGFDPLAGEKNRILIAQCGMRVVGLLIDEIIDIKAFPRSRVEPFAEAKGKIGGVIYDGEHLIAVIGPETLEEIVERHRESIIVSDPLQEQGREAEHTEVVVFRLGSQEYALGIEQVGEIIDMSPLTRVAQAPDAVEGVINIRGQIVTIGSLHRRLGIESPSGTNGKIIICETPRGRMGFFVDGVSDVMAVREDEMRCDGERGEVFSHTLCFEEGKRLVLLFDPQQLFGTKEGK